MQLGRREPLARPDDLARGLAAAAQRAGHRPAVTVLTPGRREEQGFASLAQWAAKGAHLLEIDASLGPDTRLELAGPPSWMAAAVCLAGWWVGATVVVGEHADAVLAIAHEKSSPSSRDVLWFGDAVDGSPTETGHGPAYAVEVQAFPDQPPPPRADAQLVALETAAGSLTQGELIDEARQRWDTDGVLGLDLAMEPDPALWVAALAARPAVTGQPTVVLAGVDRDEAADERIGVWADADPQRDVRK